MKVFSLRNREYALNAVRRRRRVLEGQIRITLKLARTVPKKEQKQGKKEEMPDKWKGEGDYDIGVEPVGGIDSVSIFHSPYSRASPPVVPLTLIITLPCYQFAKRQS